MKTRNLLLSIVMATMPCAGGCMWTPELSQIKQDLARQLPGTTFKHDMSLSIGPGGMALARAVTSFIPPARDARAWLKDVSRVEVAVYDLHSDRATTSIETPARIQEMIDKGWEMAARVRERDQSVWVLYRMEGESVRELFVMALDREELTMVKVKGRLERVIGRVLSDREVWPHTGRYRHHRT